MNTQQILFKLKTLYINYFSLALLVLGVGAIVVYIGLTLFKRPAPSGLMVGGFFTIVFKYGMDALLKEKGKKK